MEEDVQYSTVQFKSGASAPKNNKEELSVYSSIKIKKPLTSVTQNKDDNIIYSQVELKNLFQSEPSNQNETIYSDIKEGEQKRQKENGPKVQAAGRRFCLLAVCSGIICFLLCASIIIIIIYFTMETHKQKQNLSELEAKNKQLNLEKRLLQNKTEDLTMNVTKLENQTEQLTAEKKFFEIQIKKMTVNPTTILQKQIEQLRSNSEAIIKYTNFPGNLFCPDGACQTCPKDWIQFKGSCYFFSYFNDPWKTWDESRQFCQRKNSDLVVINNHEEQTFIKNRIEYYYDEWHGYWIGLRRINNNWIWVDNSQDTLGYWKNPGSSDNFVHIVHDHPLKQSWVQIRNGFQNRFICEVKAFIF
ncbi:hypothetical protein OJAV_G00165410 [Oryzias javanicus]|uniref:C-type lectin domain-containing protein n=1 Tax=Oryzias javanicus TaxID=123683 RepID=A0A3S2NZR6_ORYJA|nr:hypothetical protein OJAV_G00165410 [Oryzias javanicus]